MRSLVLDCRVLAMRLGFFEGWCQVQESQGAKGETLKGTLGDI